MKFAFMSVYVISGNIATVVIVTNSCDRGKVHDFVRTL